MFTWLMSHERMSARDIGAAAASLTLDREVAAAPIAGIALVGADGARRADGGFKPDVVAHVFDLRDIMRSVVQLTAGRIHAAKLTQDVDLPSDPPPLCGDERKTKQIPLNLITNSISGAITISVRWNIDIDIGVANTVADTGIGIPEKDLARMLKPFEQIDSSMSRERRGIGLGLPLVKRSGRYTAGGSTSKASSASGPGSPCSSHPSAYSRAEPAGVSATPLS